MRMLGTVHRRHPCSIPLNASIPTFRRSQLRLVAEGDAGMRAPIEKVAQPIDGSGGSSLLAVGDS